MVLGRAVFARAARMFKQSMASAIPQMQFDTRMCGAALDDGVEILFCEASGTRHAECSTEAGKGYGQYAADSDCDTGSKSQSDDNQPGLQAEADTSGSFAQEGADGTVAEAKQSQSNWSSNLGELSEGQRSICALVFVMSAASAGVKPAVLLVDEVDAALGTLHAQLGNCRTTFQKALRGMNQAHAFVVEGVML